MMRYIFTILLLTVAVHGFAATGDILYQNCTSASGCNGGTLVDPTRPSSPAWVRSVEASGCQSGSCLKLSGYENILSSLGLYGAGNTLIGTTSVSGHNEITVSVWMKFSSSSIRKANLKMTRHYTGGQTYFSSLIIPVLINGSDIWVSYQNGTVVPASWFELTTTASNNDYVTDNGDGTYTTNTGRVKGSFNASAPAGVEFGATWVKVTHWTRLPTSNTARDGAVKVWVNDSLVVDLYDLKPQTALDQFTFSKLTWYPSSEAEEEFEHWMDEMIVYEGYVPPVEDPGPTRSNKSPSATLPAGTTSVNLTLTTDN